MTPAIFGQHLLDLQTGQLHALAAYLADPAQWVEQTQGTLRWGWLSGPTPSDLASLALSLCDTHTAATRTSQGMLPD